MYLRRYWPGRAPDWVQEREGERADSEGDDASEDEEEAGVTAAIAPPVVIRASDDPRLRRLAEACAFGLAAIGHATTLARLMTQEQSGVGLESCPVPAGNVSTRPGCPESAAPGPFCRESITGSCVALGGYCCGTPPLCRTKQCATPEIHAYP
jgi:hypothetical protein